MWEGTVSPQTLCELVAREGEPWGLVPFYDEVRGKVFVCEQIRVGESVGGLLSVDERPLRIIASVSPDLPFSAVLANRLNNGEVDLAARAKKLDKIQKKRREAAAADYEADIRARWRRRNLIMALPGQIVNRQTRRAAASLRRRAEEAGAWR